MSVSQPQWWLQCKPWPFWFSLDSCLWSIQYLCRPCRGYCPDASCAHQQSAYHLDVGGTFGGVGDLVLTFPIMCVDLLAENTQAIEGPGFTYANNFILQAVREARVKKAAECVIFVSVLKSSSDQSSKSQKCMQPKPKPFRTDSVWSHQQSWSVATSFTNDQSQTGSKLGQDWFWDTDDYSDEASGYVQSV